MAFRNLLQFVSNSIERAGLARLLQRAGRADDQLYVLAYHRVDDFGRQPLLNPDLISALPAQFEQQMRLIAREYQPVSAQDVLAVVERNAPLPRNAVLVTVDDAYCDFKEIIFPILGRYGIRPILFVATAYVEHGMFWWDRLFQAVYLTPGPEIATPLGALPIRTPTERASTLKHLMRYVRQTSLNPVYGEADALFAKAAHENPNNQHFVLSWEELRALARAGVTIAAHTHTHPILSRISLERARTEICKAQTIIAREIGTALPIFAFPDGKVDALNKDLISLLREQGFKLAFSMIAGRARLHRDNLLCLPRLGMTPGLSLAQFHLRLTPIYDQWKRLGR